MVFLGKFSLTFVKYCVWNAFKRVLFSFEVIWKIVQIKSKVLDQQVLSKLTVIYLSILYLLYEQDIYLSDCVSPQYVCSLKLRSFLSFNSHQHMKHEWKVYVVYMVRTYCVLATDCFTKHVRQTMFVQNVL